MEIDFHFACVYVLARSAGFRESPARTLAYACQYVDHSTRIITYQKNGERITVLPTASKVHWDLAIRIEHQIGTMLPFHLLPGEEGTNLLERSIVRPDSRLGRGLLDLAREQSAEPHALHLVATALHAHVDSWAHQGYSAFVSDVNDLDSTGKEGIIHRTWRVLRAEGKAPRPIGHERTGAMPDWPWSTGSYRTLDGKMREWDNPVAYLAAARSAYEFLCRYLSEAKADLGTGKSPAKWGELEERIENLFRAEGEAKGWTDRPNKWRRLRFWLKKIHEGYFGFVPEEKLFYDENAWLREAFYERRFTHSFLTHLRGVLGERIVLTLTPRAAIETSNWHQFHTAARIHRQYVLARFESGAFAGLI